MQATRATAALRAPLAMRRTAVRCLTTTANPAHVESSSSPAASSKQSTIPLSNIAAQWDTLSSEEKHSVFVDLEAAQKKDWKTLSLDEKRAGEPFPRALLQTFPDLKYSLLRGIWTVWTSCTSWKARRHLEDHLERWCHGWYCWCIAHDYSFIWYGSQDTSCLLILTCIFS